LLRRYVPDESGSIWRPISHQHKCVALSQEAKSAAARKKDPNIALSREQKAKLQYAREMEHWREEDEKFHESNRAVSTALFLWNENSKEGPQKPQQYVAALRGVS